MGFSWSTIPVDHSFTARGLVGLCVNVPRMLLGKHDRHQQYPFGPFLAGGGLLVMFVGTDPLLAWAGISFTG